MTKKKEKAEEEAAITATLEQLILDRKVGKYASIPLISFWAKELRRREENRHLTLAEILDAAITDVFGGKVSEEDLAEKLAKAPPEVPSDLLGDGEKGKKK